MNNQIFQKIKESIRPSEELVTSTITRINNQKKERTFRFRTLATCSVLICLVISTLVISSLNSNKATKNIPKTVAGSDISSIDFKSLPIQKTKGDFIIDVYNPNEFVGFADYVFIGYVNELVSTEYINKYVRKGKNYSTPITNYSITVMKNIKGSLKTEESIIVQKHGGIYEDKSAIQLWEDDQLPEKGKMYVFIGITQSDSRLLISGPNSNIALEPNINKENLDNSEIVKLYVNAYNNQIEYDKDRVKCIYDVLFTNSSVVETSSEYTTVESKPIIGNESNYNSDVEMVNFK